MRKFSYALLLVLFAAMPALGQSISVPYTMFKLDNGLTVILHEDHSTPTVSVNMWYHVGSGSEKPGRTGFAHLFEHIMFEGSENVPEGMFDVWLESAGANNNGSTTEDRTNYYEDMPSNALELALFLESDRMGFLVGSMSPERVDGQRDVVKNERRQSYENSPYGMSWLAVNEVLYPKDHPYHWPVIGSMDDLSAAGYDDVIDFFKNYYGPANASISIAGDINIDEAKALVEKWFGEIPASEPVMRPEPTAVKLAGEVRLVMEDEVQLPQLKMVWHTPALFKEGDADMDLVAQVLAGGKNSRLYKKLVYEMQIAQNVFAFQSSSRLGSQFYIVATARPGIDLDQIQAVIQTEIDLLKSEAPTERETTRVINGYESQFLTGLQDIGGFSGKANQLNSYYFATGEPDYFETDLARYKALTPADVQKAAQMFLLDDARLLLSVVPAGETEAGIENSEPFTSKF